MIQKKTEKANIKNKSGLYFLIGINIVLLLLLLSFEGITHKEELGNINPDTFRDLTKPVGALNESRLNVIII